MNAINLDPSLVLVEADEPSDELSLEEHREYRALPKHLRANWRAARIAAKRAVASALELPDAGQVVIGAEPSGAPRAFVASSSGPTEARVFLSIAHRDGRAAAIAHLGGPVGVDIERSGMVAPGAERFFLSEQEQVTTLYCTSSLWTLKEAAWKALECHNTTPFSALRLLFDPEGVVTGVELFGFRYRARAEVLRPWPGFLLGFVLLESLAP